MASGKFIETSSLVPSEIIEAKIFLIRGKKVMLDKDLAELYEVKPIVLRQQVKRNHKRFPPDFMFHLTEEETEVLLSQNVIPSKRSLGGYLPYAFTEQGIAMLSSVLHSERAIQVNIQVMRTFTKLREMLSNHEMLRQKIEAMESKYDEKFKIVFEAIRQLLQKKEIPNKNIGFISENIE